MIKYGIANFDNIGQAFIAVFQILTIENWTIIMDNVTFYLNNILIVF